MGRARDIKPITYLKESTADAVRQVSEGRTLFITQNGEAKAVLMDVATYDRWRQAMALLKLLSLGEDDITKGRIHSTKVVLERFDRGAKRKRTKR
ncbi:MAG: type II toxin-antitoxin system Phd/YefM family antitoxin [Gemmatimonadaceae bacterium]